MVLLLYNLSSNITLETNACILFFIFFIYFELIKPSLVSSFRLLSAICCNLDSLLLLESQYKLSDVLLQSQKDNMVESSTGQEYVQHS